MPTDFFLLGHTHNVASVTRGLVVLVLNMKSPEVIQLSMDSNYFQSLQVFMDLVVQTTGQDLAIFFLYVLLSVQ